MEGLLEMQQREMMMTSAALDVKDAGVENFVAEKLRELLLALSSFGSFLLEKFDDIFSPETQSAVTPHDSEWIFRLTAVLLIGLSLGGLIYYIFFRCSGCSGGGWGATKMLKAHRRNARTALYEHECIVAALMLLLLIILSLGGLYYYYCYQSTCFGSDDVDATMTMVKAAGRKERMMVSGR